MTEPGAVHTASWRVGQTMVLIHQTLKLCCLNAAFFSTKKKKMEEGRALYLKALQHRIRLQWNEARMAFEAAARLGNADACWYLFANDEWQGLCYVENEEIDDEEFKNRKDGYLRQGAKLGHPLCQIAKCLMLDHLNWENLPHPLPLCAEIMWHQMCPDDPLRTFTPQECEILKKEAEKAIPIHDPWPVVCYFDYLVEHPEMIASVDPCMIAHAIFTFTGAEKTQFTISYQSTSYKKYVSFNYLQVVKYDRFRLSTTSIDIIDCVLGQLAHRFDRLDQYENRSCLTMYRGCKQRSNDAAIAWMGCFRRKALPHLSRDTTNMIAKMIASPLEFLLVEKKYKLKGC